ncbi:hypothetical protein [uncultured Erythrobacter sp.]|uniref:hypothetical protein n=1 Tax=uncultured Erythrobacter sp. TaxID=263913 RepID=UPI002613F8A3|nr:hypothetical protein [uncultured Erythrobacter sp.]
MSKHIHTELEQGKARIVAAPVANSTPKVDRSFGLPKELYFGTIAGYLGFLAITGLTFMNPVLIIPMAIFVVFIVAGFGVPSLFTRLKGNDSKALTLGEFRTQGIATNSGTLHPRDAAVQVLILPVLLVLWGIAAATIAVLVS